MENKLKMFGFTEFDAIELIKKGKLKTGHGTYAIKEDCLTLKKNDGTSKEWKINEIGCDDNE